MKRIILPIFILFSCVQTVCSQTTVTDTIVSNGIPRSYRLYIPAVYNSTSSLRPLIINMHGYTSNATEQQLYSDFAPIADTANFLMVYPEGTYMPFTAYQYWNANFSTFGVNDILFISNLIDTLKEKYRIDLSRVYSTGFSNGGIMSYSLACELSNRIAAIASVSGTIADTQFGSNCHPLRTVPVLHFHGTSDMTVPFNGGNNFFINLVSVDSVISYWVHNNNCNTIPEVSAVPNVDTTDNSTVTHYIYHGSNSDNVVEYYKITGGGHTWPGAPKSSSSEVTNQDINASKEIWRFFNSYQLKLPTGISESAKDIVSIYPNPANTVLHFTLNTDNPSETVTVRITDILGSEVSCFRTNLRTIPVKTLTPGMYFLSVTQNSKTTLARFIKTPQ